jgi:hypothetical protein
MSSEPGEQLREEPQSERGDVGARDTGSDEPAGGPVNRPAGKSDAAEGSSVDPKEQTHDDSEAMPPA